MKVEIFIPDESIVPTLIADILPADRTEVEAMGFDLEYAVKSSINQSAEVYAFQDEGGFGSVVGIIEGDLVSAPRPWMLSTNHILNRPKEVLKVSRVIFNQWIERYGYMANHVDQRHTRAVHWLRWLGARFTPEPTFGPYRRPFYLFEFGEP